MFEVDMSNKSSSKYNAGYGHQTKQTFARKPQVIKQPKAWFPYNRPDRLKKFTSDRDDPNDRGDYMEITGSPRSSQSSQTRAHTVEGLEFVNLLWARNGFKMAARNRRAGLAAIYLIVLAVIRRRRERKFRRKHRPEPDLTFFFIFKNRPYAVQIFLYFFSASAASILKISPIFSQ